ncbi:GntR family transcriptional regulator [Pandoraea anhela]|uniref:Transcriptional regulator n=1 Tax=Pandoraea anhela TaxID=2508295 RepID=A0A5E4X2L0_9BURK|nr:GntR family transcriptional regulator [Pandoraea anhela]VVE30466.1 transcriptional regulator [Pandoraea anhela]
MNQTQRTPALSDSAYNAIRNLIVSGEIRAGEALSERALSERFGISRTPVREAIRALANDGLLEIVPMRGTFVRQLSVRDLSEIHEVRLALEGMAAWLAAQKGVTPALDEVAARLRALDAQGDEGIERDVDITQRVGWQFHEAMFAAADNVRLTETYHALRTQNGLALQRIPHYDAERTRTAVREHLAIFEAIAAGRPEEAQRRVWDHLTHAMQARLQALVPPAVPPEAKATSGRPR